jgi:hypothetical protein
LYKNDKNMINNGGNTVLVVVFKEGAHACNVEGENGKKVCVNHK